MSIQAEVGVEVGMDMGKVNLYGVVQCQTQFIGKFSSKEICKLFTEPVKVVQQKLKTLLILLYRVSSLLSNM